MGSDSDLPRLEPAITLLQRLEIPCEVRVLSAHRTPKELAAFLASTEKDTGVFLCAAGGAAHLAGVVAAHSTLPVLGVPMPSKHLQGLDSLLSTVQMPKGIPVATFAIGDAGAANAALFAVAILALSDEKLAKKLAEFRRRQTEAVLQAAPLKL